MSSLGDSSAELTSKKVLSQHQAAITLLANLLSNPEVHEIDWLDLACGKGQIISQLEDNIYEKELRNKITYYGFDIENKHLKTTERIAKTLNFKDVIIKTGEIIDFDKIYKPEEKFRFISFTNTIHELRPHIISSLIINLIVRLNSPGILYIYDMETLPTPELGAVPWEGYEVKEILQSILTGLGIEDYQLVPQKWNHTSCSGWSININREHLKISNDELLKNHEQATKAGALVITEKLNFKLKATREALEVLTTTGAENEEEELNKVKLLYSLWSLIRALEEIG